MSGYRGLVYGVGVSSSGKYSISQNYTHTREFTLWKNMLRRCYNAKEQLKSPTYLNCYVSENFKNFQFFAEWCNNQIGFGYKGWQLDKDILVRGNRVYSEVTCCFVPRDINQLLTDAKSIRGEYPVGVSFDKRSGKFSAYMCKHGKKVSLGQHLTPEAAHLAYVSGKEGFVKEVATFYRDIIDPRVYEALLQWRVIDA